MTIAVDLGRKATKNKNHEDLFQNCLNGFAPLNRRGARAPDKKSFR